MKKIPIFLFFIFVSTVYCYGLDNFSTLPTSYKGRFRPIEAYSRLYLEELQGSQQINEKNLSLLQAPYPSSVLAILMFHFTDSPPELEREYEKLTQLLGEKGFFGYELSSQLDIQFPLRKRLLEAGETLRMLPSRYKPSEWFSLKALKLKVFDVRTHQLEPIKNFTSFSNQDFEMIKKAYLELESAFLNFDDESQNLAILTNNFAHAYLTGYNKLSTLPYQIAHNHSLYYPTMTQLYLEAFYFHYPLFDSCLLMYFISLILFVYIIYYPYPKIIKLSLAMFLIAFILHSLILALRCYVLQRPPVSNMFETVIYVPWIAIFSSLLLGWYYKNKIILLASNIVCLLLLVLLKLTSLDDSFENVQPVLNSQYWLIIHVLMIVGSYGLFCISGMLGHFYLVSQCLYPNKVTLRLAIGELVNQSMFFGLILLIAGTLLGGVWAAESWGRFWDWDPKESWAFISICVYLIFIHCYMFKYIGFFGLAIGSIMGLQAISFTWYGVNYLLGTGLHSYGFGSGGIYYYFMYLIVESAFLIWVLQNYRKKINEN